MAVEPTEKCDGPVHRGTTREGRHRLLGKFVVCFLARREPEDARVNPCLRVDMDRLCEALVSFDVDQLDLADGAES